MSNLVIYTDLDGSLLDHYDYNHRAADTLLSELDTAGTPVIPVSSKTYAELLPLRQELHSRHPFIVENGAAILVPDGYFDQQPADTEARDGYWRKCFSPPRHYWLQLIHRLEAAFAGDFVGFAQMSIDEIARLTGLDRAAAARAAAREYGEPVLWTGSDAGRERFILALQREGAQVLQGGRFLHLSGNCDKGQALHWLHRHYRQASAGQRPLSLAIGDSQNDVAMLERADWALIVRSPAHPPPTLTRNERTRISEAYGPLGWAQGVRSVLGSLPIRKSPLHG